MKVQILCFLSLVLLLLFGCKDSSSINTPPSSSKIILLSIPDSASIYLNDNLTYKKTPDSLLGLMAGDYRIKLAKFGYFDTTLNITLRENYTYYQTVKLTPLNLSEFGIIIVNSNPSGAEIYLNDSNTSKRTPDTIFFLSQGLHTISLSLDSYKDTIIPVMVYAGEKIILNINMKAMPISIQEFNNLKIYEMISPYYSGLDLSTGLAVMSTGPLSDIYFNGSTEKDSIVSSHLRPPSSGVEARKTFFIKGLSNSLYDGFDAPSFLKDTLIWGYSMGITAGNYYYAFDTDSHYSKIKVLNTGGGTGSSDPYRWVLLSYLYNKNLKDRRF